MRSIVPLELSQGRLRVGSFRTDDSEGCSGIFTLLAPTGAMLKVIASGGKYIETEGWEHVSVSLPDRCPNWPEMCFIKDLFWEEEETVIQLHPPRSTYISNHPYCLHLWRNTIDGHSLPPAILVGVKAEGELRDVKRAAEVAKKYGLIKTRK